MRNLSAPMLASIAKTITDPVYLFKLDLGSQYVYATSREQISYGGDNYITQGARLASIDNQRVRFGLPNHDRSVSALAFAGQIQNNECEVFLYYEGETVGRFLGRLDAPECSGDYNEVLFTAVGDYGVVSRWPYDRMRPPTFNHLPAPGTIIRLGASNLHLEKDFN